MQEFSTYSLDLTGQEPVAPGIYQTPIKGLYALPVKPYEDERGFFAEVSKIPHLNEVLEQPFVVKQVNHAHSKINVCRGFHAEDWNKLVTVTSGVCFSAIVDIRKESETFGTVLTLKLGHAPDAFFGSLFLPSGVANSVCTLTESIDYLYAVDKLYQERNPAGDLALSLFDETINLDWPIAQSEMIISERDRNAVSLTELLANS